MMRLFLTFVIVNMMGGKTYKARHILRPGTNYVFPASALTGIEFGDNGVQKYLTEDNGVAVARTEVFIEDHSLLVFKIILDR